MKKNILTIVLLVAMLLMVGCGNHSIAKNIQTIKPTLSTIEEPCNTNNNKIEEREISIGAINTAKSDLSGTIFSLNSISVFITSNKENLNEIDSLSMNYISLKLVTEATVGTDVIKRESLRPRKITHFGKILTINYDKTNPVTINDVKLNVNVTFSGAFDDAFNKEDLIDLVVRNNDGEVYLIGELILDEISELKLVFEAEIEKLDN